MLIVIASDTHGRTSRLSVLEKAYPAADFYLHAGDCCDLPEEFEHWLAVEGNNDIYYTDTLPQERVITTPFGSIFMTHGHKYPVSSRKQKIVDAAKQKGCAVAVFGHTHSPLVETLDDVLLVNPGSLYRNRTGEPISYAILEWTAEKMEAKICSFYDLPQSSPQNRK